MSPDGRRTFYAYRADNLLSQITWPDSTTITYQYDNNKRVINETAGSEVTLYSYNTVDQLTSATGPGGTVSYTYDNAGRIVTETSGGRTNTIVRNAEGERIRLDYMGQSQTYSRDVRGLVTRIAAPAGNFDFAFDALGRRTQLNYPNGSTASYAFDAAGQLTNLTHAGVFNAPYAHTFDAAGRITKITGDGPDWNYSYDALGRLTRASQAASTYTYTLDAVGNILDGGRAHDLNHRLTVDSNKNYSYDQRGNLTLELDRTTGARTAYSWNAKNQLLRIDFFADAVAVVPIRTLQYTYDPLGRRASKTDNGVVQKFVYDGDDAVGMLDAGGGVVAANVFGGAIDEPLASITGASTKTLYSNHLGSVMGVTEGAALINSYRYGPYGETVPPSSADSIPFRYTGREKDTESLYYYRARYYSTAQQRFISSDPIGLSGGENLYNYVQSDPLSANDPRGEFLNLIIGAGTGVATGYAIAWLTGSCYSATDALIDAGLGAAGAGLLSKLEKIRELSKLRNLAHERGLIPNKITPHIEDYINPSNPLERLKIKLSGSQNATGSLSKGPRVEYRIDAGTYQNPFTGEVGTSAALSHVPIGNPSLGGAVGGGAAGGAVGSAVCGCK